MRQSPLRFVPLLIALGFLCQVGPASASFFDVYTEVLSPFNVESGIFANPVQADVLDEIGGVMTPLHKLEQNVIVFYGPTSVYAGRVGGHDSGGAYGSPGAESFFDVYWTPLWPGQQMTTDNTFKLSTEIYLPGSSTRGQFLPIGVSSLFPDDPASVYFTTDWVDRCSVFTLECEVAVPEMAGGYLHYTFTYDASPMGGHFPYGPGFSIMLANGDESGFDIYFDVITPMPPTTERKVLTVTTTATLVPGAIGAEPNSWGGVKNLYR